MSEHPPVLPHGPIEERFDGIWQVTGAMRMAPLVTFDRNMTIVRHPGGLVLFNSIRLDEARLAELEALGTVTDVVRVGSYHGRDDAFYVDRYQATYWAPPGATQREHQALEPGCAFPIEGAEVFLFQGVSRGEAVVRLPSEGGVLLTCDALQNWERLHPAYGSLVAKLMMTPMGFFRPTSPGAGWVRAEKPDGREFWRLHDGWAFEHLLPAHGGPVIGGAKQAYAASFERMWPR